MGSCSHRRALSSLVLLLFSTMLGRPLSAQGRSGSREVKPHPEEAVGGAPIGMRVLRDLPYGSDPAQRMDVYLPSAPQRAPVLFMVHGGGWRIGDKAMGRVTTNKVNHWVGRGYIFVSVNYRMLPAADPLEQSKDIASAVAAAQSSAAGWGGDASRFILMGHSAGAHLVALLAADPAAAYAMGAKPWLATIALDSAAYDVSRIMNERHFRLYDDAFGKDPAYWRKVSPLDRLSGTPAPMLLVCSTLRKDSCEQARSFAAQVNLRQGRATVLPLALTHAEINQNLGLPGPYTSAVSDFFAGLKLP
jgi:arylformamidase